MVQLPRLVGPRGERSGEKPLAQLRVLPPSFQRHAEVGLAALAHGKHVFCEILVTMNLAESEQLLEKEAASEAFFMTGFIERFDVRRALIKQRVERGEMGQLVSIYGRRNAWRGFLEAPRFKEFPLILQPGIHTVDQMLWLAQEEVGEVYTRARKPGRSSACRRLVDHTDV